MSEKVESQKIYPGIDLFKLIAAVLVVLLHTIETTNWYPNEIKFVFTRLAVPFFFITSGFFFYRGLRKSSDKRTYFFKYEKNILKIFVIYALILYLPFVITSYIQNNPDAGGLKIVLLLVRRVLIIGPGPYWYLVALAWSIAFLYICYSKREFLLKTAIVVGLLLSLSYSCFQGFLSQFYVFRIFFKLVYFIYSWEYNFFMFGIPFAGIGFLIAKKDLNWSKAISIIILIISTVLRIIEYNIPLLIPTEFWNTNNISVAFIPQAIAFFMLAKVVEPNWKPKISLAIRQLSSWIYFTHVIILYNILNPILNYYTNIPLYSEMMILPKLLIVLVICLCLFIIIKKINNRYLNILING